EWRREEDDERERDENDLRDDVSPEPEPGRREVGPRVPAQQDRLEEDEGGRPDGTRPAVRRQEGTSDQWFDEERERRRQECDCDIEGGLRQGDRPGYSPITAQSNPIMMKKPEKRAIRPRPPYGVLAPTCGSSWRTIPKPTAQTMNRNVKRNFALVFVTRRTQRAPPSLDSAAFSMMKIISVTTAALIPKGIGCWKATRNSCIARRC